MEAGEQLFLVPAQFAGLLNDFSVVLAAISVGLHGVAVVPQAEGCLLDEGQLADTLGEKKTFAMSAHSSTYSWYKAPKSPKVFRANGSSGQYAHQPIGGVVCSDRERIAAAPLAVHLGGAHIQCEPFLGPADKLCWYRVLIKKRVGPGLIFPHGEQAIGGEIGPDAKAVSPATAQHFAKA